MTTPTIRIGRFVRNEAPHNVTRAGDVLTFSVDMTYYDVAAAAGGGAAGEAAQVIAARIERQQILGLRVGDVIPVTYSEDSSWDGFYEVAQAPRIRAHPTELANGAQVIDMNLRRIAAGYSQPEV